MFQNGLKEKGNAIVLHDPRFAEVNVSGLGDELTYLRAEGRKLEDELNTLRLRLGRLDHFEALEKIISFVCPTNGMKPKTIIACHERRHRYDCNCEARKIWIERYIL